MLEHLNFTSWDQVPDPSLQQRAIAALESGKIVYFPSLPFDLEENEKKFLCQTVCNGKSKNVSFDLKTGDIRGSDRSDLEIMAIRALMQRYATHAKHLISELFPDYNAFIKQGRTSYRPVEIAGRKAPNYRKDDTLLHIDAFPGSPVKGNRILRVFTNVNPHNQSRVWRVGEDFQQVVYRFAPQIKKQIPGWAHIQKLFHFTRDYRTAYDHYMLNIHNNMKSDQSYQKNVAQQEIKFPPGSTWIVFTDQVSHAAMAGQYVFEQTFYLPVHGLQNPQTAPLRVLENMLQRKLV